MKVLHLFERFMDRTELQALLEEQAEQSQTTHQESS